MANRKKTDPTLGALGHPSLFDEDTLTEITTTAWAGEDRPSKTRTAPRRKRRIYGNQCWWPRLREDPPYFPWLMLCLDKESGMVLATHMAKLDTDGEDDG